MKIVLTRHAGDQMILRGIEEEQIATVIKRGSKTRQTEGWLSIYRCIAVAYNIKRKDEYIIKTVMIV